MLMPFIDFQIEVPVESAGDVWVLDRQTLFAGNISRTSGNISRASENISYLKCTGRCFEMI